MMIYRAIISLLIINFFAINTLVAQKEYKAMMNDNSINFYEVCRSADAYFSVHGTEKGSGWKGYQRWKRANEYKFYPSGDRSNVDPYFVDNAYNAFLNNSQSVYFKSGWEELGPHRIDSISSQYSVGLGRVEDLYVDPNDTLKMYIGSRSGGFWRSTNGGADWVCTTDSLVATGVNTIAVSPTNPDSILINVRNSRNGTSHGIYRSVDGGLNWFSSSFNPSTVGYGGLGSNFQIYKIVYHPIIPNLVFIGTNQGIFKSTDNLQSWTIELSSKDVTEIVFHPTDTSILYVYDNYYYGGNKNRIFKSIDLGATYTASSNIAGNNNSTAHLSVSADCNNCLYFASNNGVWKSMDLGTSFTFLSNPNENCVGFAVNDLDTSKMVYGYVDIHTSSDGGRNFNKVTWWSLGNSNHGSGSFLDKFKNGSSYVHADLHPVKSINGVYYVGTDGLFCKSSDNGTTWKILSQGTAIRENYKLGVSQSNHYRSISGSQDNGTSIKHQDTWIEFYGADGMEGIIHPLNDDYMIGSVQYGNRKRTLNGGLSQSGVTPTHNGSADWEAPIAYDPCNQSSVFDFRDSIFVSEEFGSKWSYRGKASAFSGTIKHAAIAENNSDIIVIASGSSIEKSIDGGYSFSSIRNNLPNISIQDIAFDPNDDDVIMVVYANYQNDNSKIYITYNGGQNWFNITYNLGNMPIRSVVIDHTNSSNIYLGAELGVYTKTMNATAWTLYNPSLPNTTIEELEIVYGSNTIKAATWGRGLWEYSLIGRNSYPSILTTNITDKPTDNAPKEGFSQYVTSVISYQNSLTNVYLEWSKDTISLGNIISMVNTQDSTWVSSSAIPNFVAGTKVFFKVFAVGASGDTSETYRFMYKVQEFDYCYATGNNNSGNLYISDLSIANINNTSQNDAYTYYADSVVYMFRDSTYSISVKSNTSWASNDFGAWIDFNYDANLDTAESLHLVETANNIAQATFTIPSDAVLTDTIRLRVRLSHWGSEAKACGNTYGEVEDYPVMIIVIDSIAPVLDSTALSDITQECSSSPNPPTATDNVLGVIYGVPDVVFPITTLGNTLVTWTFADANGNFVQQTQNIIITPVDTTVTKVGYSLAANAGGYNYQWVDCGNGFSHINGAVNQTYNPVVSGDYAVVIYNNSCNDTSSCIGVWGVGIDEFVEELDLIVYPNPNSGIIYIDKGKSKELSLDILDMTGRTVGSKVLYSKITEFDLQNYASGIYFFRFNDGQKSYYIKVVKE